MVEATPEQLTAAQQLEDCFGSRGVPVVDIRIEGSLEVILIYADGGERKVTGGFAHLIIHPAEDPINPFKPKTGR